MPCVGLFTLLGVPRSCVIGRVLLLFWDGCCLSLRSCAAPFTWLPLARIRALPRSPGDRSCRRILEPLSPRSLFTRARLVSCAAGQPALLVLFVIMLALTPASSTPALCPRSLFATLVTSRRRVLERRRREALPQGLLVRRLPSCPSLPRGLAQDQSSRRSATPPLKGRKRCLPLPPHQRLAPSCS